jgi:hypothetical protein
MKERPQKIIPLMPKERMGLLAPTLILGVIFVILALIYAAFL